MKRETRNTDRNAAQNQANDSKQAITYNTVDGISIGLSGGLDEILGKQSVSFVGCNKLVQLRSGGGVRKVRTELFEERIGPLAPRLKGPLVLPFQALQRDALFAVDNGEVEENAWNSQVGIDGLPGLLGELLLAVVEILDSLSADGTYLLLDVVHVRLKALLDKLGSQSRLSKSFVVKRNANVQDILPYPRLRLVKKSLKGARWSGSPLLQLDPCCPDSVRESTPAEREDDE